MTRTRTALRRLRLLVQLVVAVVVLTWVPTIAQAAFFDADAAPVTVGTYDIPAPVGVTGTYNCTSTKLSMTVTISDFGAVARATGYTVTLTSPSGTVTTNNLSATNRATTITRSSLRTGTFTLRLRAAVGTWTGDDAVYQLTCPA